MTSTAVPRSLPRILFCLALVISWMIMMAYAWSAFSTMPTPERLETSRMSRIPTIGTLTWLAARSVLELAAMVGLAWPASRRYATRLFVALIALAGWFFATAPLTLTGVEWVHRRWLAAVWAGFLLALIVTAAGRMFSAGSQRLRAGEGSRT